MILLKIVEEGLRGITLAPLTRPAVSPFDEPTEELVHWATRLYVYSSIAHVRTVLAGLIALADIGNTPTGNILSRHIFEWTAHACYMAEGLKELIFGKQWKRAFDLTLQADIGNLWLKSHGHQYDTAPFPEEIPTPIRVGKLMSAYAKYQTEQYGKTKAHDSYGYLSEYSHPNGACFLQYREITGADAHFVSPPSRSSFGGINGFILEWLMFMQTLLGFAKEDCVRDKLIDILTAVTKSA
jgi:hypothetical protein